MFCSKCRRIGHRRAKCLMPIEVAQKHYKIVMENVGQRIEIKLPTQHKHSTQY